MAPASRQGRLAPLGAWQLAALAWGFAEATLFFVVPDVLLTALAQRRGFRAAAPACLTAAIGAAIGGLTMRALGSADPASMHAVLDAIPAISPDMIASAGQALSADPLRALLAGAFSGVPYKIYAASAVDVAPLALVAMTVVARSARFLAVTALAAAIDRFAARWLGLRTRGFVLAAAWAAFYAFYWSVTPG